MVAESAIRVAIVGGGLAGTILMNALMRHSHLDVQLYEANSSFEERGASIGLSVNAQRAIDALGLSEVLEKANGVRVGCLQLFVNEGSDAGELIHDVDFDKITVHRAALLRELIVPIPETNIHFNKRLSSIQGTTLVFTDSTSTEADMIIGADGIHSGVRKFILGQGHPALKPVPSGFWDARGIVTFDEAVKKLGTTCINEPDPHQHMHIGSKGAIFHDIIEGGQMWTHKVTRKWLDEQYKGWGQFGQNGLDLLFGGKEEMPAFIHWESAETPTLYSGTTCMIGDAAHATSPWQGSGLSQAIEDCLILEKVLGRCRSIEEIPLALQVLDQVRRDHAQKVIKSSRKTAEAYFGPHGGSVQQLRKDIPSRDYFLNWDTEGAVKQAIENFELLKQQNASTQKATA